MASTREALARYGHVAKMLREEMAKREWKPGQVAKMLGIKGTPSMVYQWLNCSTGVGPKYRDKLAKWLNVAPEELLPRDLSQPEPLPLRREPVHPSDGLTLAEKPVVVYSVTNDGMARLQFDIILPVERLLRLLLDAGLVRIDVNRTN